MALLTSVVALLSLAGSALGASFAANPASLGAIPDAPASQCGTPGSARDVTFDVSGLAGPIADVGISGLEVAHAWMADLDVRLIAPDGVTEHVIFSRTGATTATGCGDSSDVAGPYTFSDGATVPPSGGWWEAATATGSSSPIPSGTYRATAPGGAGATNPAPPTEITPAFAGLANPNGTWTLRFRDFGGGDTGTVSAATLGIEMAPPPNDDFANAEPLSGADTSADGTTAGATRETGEPDHCVVATGPGQDCGFWQGDHSVWYRWSAPGSGTTTIDTCTAAIDSILAVYTGNALASLNRITDNNNHGGSCPGGWAFGSRVSFEAVAGAQYKIAVGDAGGAREDAFTLAIDGVEAPADTTPPVATITAGPPKKVKTTKRKVAATFRFKSNEAGSSFKCKLDRQAFKPCASPRKVKVKPGKHTFRVRATDPAGNTGAAAKRTWRVVRKRGGG